jgi:hypothetical protein
MATRYFLKVTSETRHQLMTAKVSLPFFRKNVRQGSDISCPYAFLILNSRLLVSAE